MESYESTNCTVGLSHERWWREWEVAALIALVVAVYFTRLTATPVCGEESRWANGAREMLATGDWIVPRQQGEIFPERPPLNSWAMALVGLARGEVDLFAVRLPSACAMLFTTLLIYAYARNWTSRLASFSAAAIFATMGQVMGLGRAGESEAVFTMFTAGALLVWHAGYVRGWVAAAYWPAGYCLAALGALTKGPQAPTYFVCVTTAFLLWQREWRRLFCWGHLLGAACFAVVVGAWLVPFAAADWEAIDDIWAGLAQDRFTSEGLLRHLAVYPAEVLGCWLPWSPLLIPLLKPSVWRTVLARRPQMKFVLTALAVTFPTVWLAAGARGRYYMPLYPCVAILMGLMVEHCTAEGASLADRLIWRRYQRGLCATVAISGIVVVVASTLSLPQLAEASQPALVVAIWLVTSIVTAAVLAWASLSEQRLRPIVAMIAAAGFAGFAYAGPIVNSRKEGANDLKDPIARIKQFVPDPAQMTSLGRVYHRFAFCYDEPIRRVPWPMTADELPPDVTYFCFDHRPTDTDAMRSAGDGRIGTTTPGTLPFAWEKIAEIPCDPVKRNEAHRSVIIGRVHRGAGVADSAISRPVRR